MWSSTFPNHGSIHPEWKRCLQGISRTDSSSSNSSKHTGHFRPLSVGTKKQKKTLDKSRPTFTKHYLSLCHHQFLPLHSLHLKTDILKWGCMRNISIVSVTYSSRVKVSSLDEQTVQKKAIYCFQEGQQQTRILMDLSLSNIYFLSTSTH